MGLDPGPIPNDCMNGDDPKKCKPGTMCYDLVPSQLVTSNHVISEFQQGHQAFPLVKLKDNYGNALGHAYHFLSPMVPIQLTHAFDRMLTLHWQTGLHGESNKKLTIPKVIDT
jgi:hypothetical protein